MVQILQQQQIVFRQRPSIFLQPSQPITTASMFTTKQDQTEDLPFDFFAVAWTHFDPHVLSQQGVLQAGLSKPHCWSSFFSSLSSLLFYLYIFSLSRNSGRKRSECLGQHYREIRAPLIKQSLPHSSVGMCLQRGVTDYFVYYKSITDGIMKS